jgi:hypothetical protein
VIGWPRTLAALLFGAVVAVLARLLLRVVYDLAVYGDHFNAPLFVIGTLLVSVIAVVAAAASTPAAIGAAVASTATIFGSWLGLRFGDVPDAGDRLTVLLGELRSALNSGYLDPGAIVLSGALVALVVLRLRPSPSTRDG